MDVELPDTRCIADDGRHVCTMGGVRGIQFELKGRKRRCDDETRRSRTRWVVVVWRNDDDTREGRGKEDSGYEMGLRQGIFIREGSGTEGPEKTPEGPKAKGYLERFGGKRKSEAEAGTQNPPTQLALSVLRSLGLPWSRVHHAARNV